MQRWVLRRDDLILLLSIGKVSLDFCIPSSFNFTSEASGLFWKTEVPSEKSAHHHIHNHDHYNSHRVWQANRSLHSGSCIPGIHQRPHSDHHRRQQTGHRLRHRRSHSIPGTRASDHRRALARKAAGKHRRPQGLVPWRWHPDSNHRPELSKIRSRRRRRSQRLGRCSDRGWKEALTQIKAKIRKEVFKPKQILYNMSSFIIVNKKLLSFISIPK